MPEINCLFCNIAAGQIPSKKVYEDDRVFAFRDINPQAPTHILLIPRVHIASLMDASTEAQALLGYLMSVAPRLASQEGIAQNGFRVVINTGSDAGQTVGHLHLHVIGGRPMTWPPG